MVRNRWEYHWKAWERWRRSEKIRYMTLRRSQSCLHCCFDSLVLIGSDLCQFWVDFCIRRCVLKVFSTAFWICNLSNCQFNRFLWNRRHGTAPVTLSPSLSISALRSGPVRFLHFFCRTETGPVLESSRTQKNRTGTGKNWWKPFQTGSDRSWNKCIKT